MERENLHGQLLLRFVRGRHMIDIGCGVLLSFFSHLQLRVEHGTAKTSDVAVSTQRRWTVDLYLSDGRDRPVTSQTGVYRRCGIERTGLHDFQG